MDLDVAQEPAQWCDTQQAACVDCYEDRLRFTCGQPVDRGEGGEALCNPKAQGLPLLQYGAPLPLLGRRGSHTRCAGGLGLEH